MAMPGSIEKRGRNSWRILICDGYRADGSKRRVYRTLRYGVSLSEQQQKRQCEKELALLYASVKAGAAVAGPQYTLEQFVRQWRHDYLDAKNVSPVTRSGYDFLLNKRILPELGRLRLNQITPQRLSRFYSQLSLSSVRGNRGRGGTLSAGTVLHYHSLLRLILGTAVRWGVLDANPALRATVPRPGLKEVRPLDVYEARRLLEALAGAPPKHRAGAMLGLLGQLRKGEIGALDWADLDWQSGLLRVERSAVYVRGEGVLVKETKTPAGKRTVCLPRCALEVLREVYEEQLVEKRNAGENWIDSGAMFTGRNGARQHPDTICRWFREFLKENGLPPMRFHDLRHTGASLLIAAGEDIETLKERLGHSRASITMDVYGHAYKAKDRQAAERLEALFGAEKGEE